MKTTTKTLIATAAIAGILGASQAFAAATGTNANAGMKVTAMEDKGTHSCKGQNSCKGQGGCKSDSNSCKGKNKRVHIMEMNGTEQNLKYQCMLTNIHQNTLKQ